MDWNLAVKAVLLSARLGERWLHSAVTGVETTRPRNRWGALQAILADTCDQTPGQSREWRRKKFARMLTRCVVPVVLLVVPEERARAERLCGAGRLYGEDVL